MHKAHALLLKMVEGSKPEFELGSYDSQGGVVKAPKEKKKVVNPETGKDEEVEVEPPQE